MDSPWSVAECLMGKARIVGTLGGRMRVGRFGPGLSRTAQCTSALGLPPTSPCRINLRQEKPSSLFTAQMRNMRRSSGEAHSRCQRNDDIDQIDQACRVLFGDRKAGVTAEECSFQGVEKSDQTNVMNTERTLDG